MSPVPSPFRNVNFFFSPFFFWDREFYLQGEKTSRGICNSSADLDQDRHPQYKPLFRTCSLQLVSFPSASMAVPWLNSKTAELEIFLNFFRGGDWGDRNFLVVRFVSILIRCKLEHPGLGKSGRSFHFGYCVFLGNSHRFPYLVWCFCFRRDFRINFNSQKRRGNIRWCSFHFVPLHLSFSNINYILIRDKRRMTRSFSLFCLLLFCCCCNWLAHQSKSNHVV